MREIREWIKEMDYEEKRDCVEGFIGFASLFWLCFMMSVIGG